MTRNVIALDCETSGLYPHLGHVVLELAAINTATGEELHLVPLPPVGWQLQANDVSMSINRYYERRVFELTDGFDETKRKLRILRDWMAGATIAGANPSFDVKFLEPLFKQFKINSAEPHYRLCDVSNLTAGACGVPAGDLPGLDRCVELLEVVNEGEHTAIGDARAVRDCLLKLGAIEPFKLGYAAEAAA